MLTNNMTITSRIYMVLSVLVHRTHLLEDSMDRCALFSSRLPYDFNHTHDAFLWSGYALKIEPLISLLEQAVPVGFRPFSAVEAGRHDYVQVPDNYIVNSLLDVVAG